MSDGASPAEGDFFVELNANLVSTLYQKFCLSGNGGTVEWSVRHRGRKGVDVANVRMGGNLATATIQQVMSDGTAAWGSYSGIFTIPVGLTELYIAFESVSAAGGDPSVGNFLDDVKINIITICPDTDGDGIPDKFDLDSDNDGIFDAVEAGHGQAHTNGVVNGTVGTDGIPDFVQTTSGSNSNIVDYTLADSENAPDGIPDFLELDSDGDLCNDVVEAGFTDTDNNGLLGTGTFGAGLTVDVNGVVTSGTDGYTGTKPEVITPGLVPTITNHPVNQSICPESDTSFTVVSNGDVFQWQIFESQNWIDLTNTGIHSNTNTDSLVITGATTLDNGNRYRVNISSSTFVCGSITSNEAILTVSDTTNPTFTCPTTPADIISDATCQGIVPDLITGLVVTDNCSAAVDITVTQNPVAGSTIGIGVTTVTITATDESGNESVCTVDLNVVRTIEANDDVVIADGILGETSPNVVDSNDDLGCDKVTLGTTVVITAVNDPDPSDGITLDPLTGKVTVSPNTPEGTYTIVYTLCSVSTPIICDDAIVTITVVRDDKPNLELTKTGVYEDANNDGIPNIGDKIKYTFTVKNTGNVDIVNIVLTDPLIGIQINGGPIDLKVDEIDTGTFTATYHLTKEDLLIGRVDNQASVTGQDLKGMDVTDISDDPINTIDIDTDGDGDGEDITVTIIELDDEIIIYTGISPNGDGQNDEFVIVGLNKFPDNTLQIFNRWGVKVFEQKAYMQDGARLFRGISEGRSTINQDDLLPVGTYYYVLEYQNSIIKKRRSKAGFLYLTR